MLRKALCMFIVVFLALSISAVFAQEKVTVTSSSTDEIQGNVQQPQKVEQMRTVVMRGKLKLQPLRNRAIQAVARDGSVPSQSVKQNHPPVNSNTAVHQPKATNKNKANNKTEKKVPVQKTD